MNIFIDFDGTITKTDTTDSLLEIFAQGDFNQIEQDWLSGRISSKDCMQAQYAMIRGMDAEIRYELEHIEIDAGFIEFCTLMQNKAKLIIVSDGIDYPIQYLLKKHGLLSIPYYSNHLSFLKEGVAISFPFEVKQCKSRCGLCKCHIFHEQQFNDSGKSILIGNGKSDVCLSHQVDFVFAKEYLLTYCQQHQIKHLEFNSFLDLVNLFQCEQLEKFL
ncbi:MtnX-like HAD-IB family phosphatase [Legionella sp. PATHC035]|uniref:MtnX-like HAD-IB family phosphatase n=1 Tax=Legionella sp. PATHC035 TaxID=2992040 RepID=UPI002243E3B6|nr:MtnX-like HAD-IB family phosphatase [Legionella sp. PATHC035]MCW8407733.1 MtnX-like HAD-IB family phosphatase [Legionella sp. PATHC035]